MDERGPEYSRGRCVGEDEEQTQEQSFAGEFHAEVLWVWLAVERRFCLPRSSTRALYRRVCGWATEESVFAVCLFALTGCWNFCHC